MKVQIWHLLSILGSAASALHCGAGRTTTAVVKTAETQAENQPVTQPRSIRTADQNQTNPEAIPVPPTAQANQAVEPISSAAFIQSKLLNTNWKNTECFQNANFTGYFKTHLQFSSTTNMSMSFPNYTDAACTTLSGSDPIPPTTYSFTLTPSDLIDGWNWDYQSATGETMYNILKATDSKLYWAVFPANFNGKTVQTRPPTIDTAAWFVKVP